MSKDKKPTPMIWVGEVVSLDRTADTCIVIRDPMSDGGETGRLHLLVLPPNWINNCPVISVAFNEPSLRRLDKPLDNQSIE